MKYFAAPAAVLALLLGLSLENARCVESDVARWVTAVEAATAAAEQEDWAAAIETLRGAQNDWDGRRPWLHVVTAHDELEAADALFAEANSFAQERDMAEFRASATKLAVQLRVVSGMQQLTLKNVL
ncbi:MAG: DUF4363 family protein [Oscillospiraceae bacterium]|nr:DUF4363 family protein [Oscillospiraceae bacterium]